MRGTVLKDISLIMETTGIEPVTPCMSSKYSNQLSYASVSATADSIAYRFSFFKRFFKSFFKKCCFFRLALL